MFDHHPSFHAVYANSMMALYVHTSHLYGYIDTNYAQLERSLNARHSIGRTQATDTGFGLELSNLRAIVPSGANPVVCQSHIC